MVFRPISSPSPSPRVTPQPLSPRGPPLPPGPSPYSSSGRSSIIQRRSPQLPQALRLPGYSPAFPSPTPTFRPPTPPREPSPFRPIRTPNQMEAPLPHFSSSSSSSPPSTFVSSIKTPTPPLPPPLRRGSAGLYSTSPGTRRGSPRAQSQPSTQKPPFFG
ncbi:MAG: hypothetical protein JSR76_04890 [Verrucomicrobia bacterium]|nr:hypothetical protein [Verrucomicrobiota bacterium]